MTRMQWFMADLRSFFFDLIACIGSKVYRCMARQEVIRQGNVVRKLDRLEAMILDYQERRDNIVYMPRRRDWMDDVEDRLVANR